ncbi:LPS assembly lipoprotein LptE [Azoarcus sp. DN11]|uniref:LPS-assembly lipoprotein LptE n=1 Tax=Azoarcus sp. DN11 TaxID=356837 RepID=UPI000EABB8E1|nr:LPS assembly lipoprotein LptE [Azoarcus sp. DN11]AYH42505.1 hypothetical protein CDA09_03735 [Azoarcus sp. DN11]
MIPSRSRRSLLRALGTLGATTALAGCGFQLRGPRPLAFSTIHMNVTAQSDFGAALRRRIRTSGTTEIVDDPTKAEMRLEILRNQPDREILTLTGAGKVREYELRHTLTFRLVDRAGTERIHPTTISAKREYTYDDSQALAKEQEEALLYRDMQGDLVDQLMRRLAAYKP